MTPFQPKNKRELLAFTIAQIFDDMDSVSQYLKYCKKYPLHIVQRAFSEAKNYDRPIKKSRKALFIYLLKTYGQKSH
jgi:hypothetical protein